MTRHVLDNVVLWGDARQRCYSPAHERCDSLRSSSASPSSSVAEGYVELQQIIAR